MRVKLADANTPRDYEFADRLQRHKAEIERRLAQLGATVESIEDATEYAFEAHFAYDGDLKALADRVEDVRGAEVLSLGHSLQIVKDLGRRRVGRRPLQAGRARGHARDRARPHGDGVRRRHLGRAPVLGVSVLRHRRRAQRAADELPPVEAPARARRAPVPVRVRLRDHRGLPRREDGRGRRPRRRDAPVARGARRRLHLHLRDRGRAGHGQGRAGRQAARALRGRRPGRARLGGDRDPRGRRP